MEKIKGILEEIIYANDANGYKVCVFSSEDVYITAKGIMPLVAPGEYIELTGNWEEHPTYGPQFSVSEYEKKMPESLEDIENFLSSGLIEGIGMVTAHLIVEKFGKETMNVIANQPELLEKIKGISHQKAMRIHTTVEEHKDMSELVSFLAEYQIGSGTAVRIFTLYGKESVEKIKENPYALYENISGISFAKAEEIAMRLEKPADFGPRITAGIRSILQNAEGEGHVFLPRTVLNGLCAEILSCREEDTEEALQKLIKGAVVYADYSAGEERIYLFDLYKKEKYIASKLKEMASFKHKMQKQHFEDSISRFSEASGTIPDETQKAAVSSAARNGVSVITGGPGTGKTTIIRCIIEYFSSIGIKCVLAAPTGRAAKRMTEACRKEAKTIHRLLEVNGEIDGGADASEDVLFKRNEMNPIDCDAIILDECSMIDMTLFYHMVKALKPRTRLIMVGDVDQLPPVGAGTVLSDTINSGKFNTVVLDKIYRQENESLIPENAYKINHGEMPKVNIEKGDFFFIREKTKEDISNTVISLCRDRLIQKYKIDDMSSVQVIIATKKGPCGTMAMNEALQNALNPAEGKNLSIQNHGVEFRLGDRVMQTRNNYETEWVRHGVIDEDGKGIFNGEMGRVTYADAKAKMIQVTFDDNRIAEYDSQTMGDLDLCYAITVHKSQGSEFDYCIIPVFDAVQALMSRNLLYTAVTRARKMVILVGNEHSLAAMVRNNKISVRYTGLRERLCEDV